MKIWQRLRTPWVQRGLISLALLGAVILWADPQAVLAEVQRLSLGWMLLALMISVLQVMLSAWRWKFTADLIAVPLRYRYALREYYLALLVNQLLPGGVLGDAGRAHRHARQSSSRGSAWRAVVIERASGQGAVVLLTLAALLTSPLWHAALGWPVLAALGAVMALAGALCVGAILWLRHTSAIALPSWCHAFARDVKQALLQRGVWLKQLLSSLAIVLSYGLVMVCAARAIGVELPALDVLALTPLLLLAMLVPLSIAGWGLREGAAAAVWVFVGLPSAQGVAVSLAYGVLIMLSSLPGIWVALRKRTKATPSGGDGLAQTHVKQNVIATSEGAHGRAQRTLQGVDRRHLQPWSAGTNQHGSYQQMQTLNCACFNKLRNGNATAFYQHARKATFCQQRNDIAWVELAGGIKRQYAMLCNRRLDFSIHPCQVQRGRRFSIEQFQVGRHAAAGVDNNARGVLAKDMTYRQLRVVGTGGSSAHQYGVRQCTQAVQVYQALETVDVVGVAAFGGNSAIQALPQLSDAPGRAACQRQQAVQQLTSRGRYRKGAIPSPAGVKRNILRAGHSAAYSHQPRPGGRHINGRASLRISSHTYGVGHHASHLDRSNYHVGSCCLTQAHSAHFTRQPGGLHVSH